MQPRFCLINAALGVSAVYAQDAQISPSMTIPAPAPSETVDRSFVGFGIEAKGFPQYTGNKSAPNEFSQNMLASLYNRTGSPVYIRVGGTSMDHARYNPDQDKTVVHTDDTTDLHANLTLGKPWVESFPLFQNTKWVVQVPLARKNLSNAITFVKACLNSMGTQNLDSFEIGNEPNLYLTTGNDGHPDRGPNYDPADYARQFRNFAGNISDKGGLGKGPHFQALGLSSRAGGAFTAEKIFDGGINDNGLVKSVSQHYYQTSADSDLQKTLMDHSATTTALNHYSSSIQYMKNHHKNIPFVLGEVGSALGHGVKNLTMLKDMNASLGSALWTVDFLLYAITQGVKRVSMQLGVNFAFCSWQPVSTKNWPAAVHGNWYGHVFVADFIGKLESLTVKELDTKNQHISAYAGYSSGKLAKIAVADLELWREDWDSPRPKKNITISGLDGVKTVKVEKLTGPSGGALENITWAGYEWTAKRKGIPEKVKNTTVTRNVEGGNVELRLQASEALLISLQQ